MAHQGRPWPRLVAMSRSGRFVALRGPGAVELVDALGTAPRTALPADGPGAPHATTCQPGEQYPLQGRSLVLLRQRAQAE